jgi:hypothetical protein
VNGIGRMIGYGNCRRRELLLIDRGVTRSKGEPNRHKNPWDDSTRPVGLGLFWAGSGPSFSSRLILAFCTWTHSFVSFCGHHPRDQDRGSSCIKSEHHVLVLRDDPS